MTTVLLGKQDRISPKDEMIKEILLKGLSNVKNGSLTIVKQDDHVIQVNVYERYLLKDDFTEPKKA